MNAMRPDFMTYQALKCLNRGDCFGRYTPLQGPLQTARQPEIFNFKR